MDRIFGWIGFLDGMGSSSVIEVFTSRTKGILDVLGFVFLEVKFGWNWNGFPLRKKLGGMGFSHRMQSSLLWGKVQNREYFIFCCFLSCSHFFM